MSRSGYISSHFFLDGVVQYVPYVSFFEDKILLKTKTDSSHNMIATFQTLTDQQGDLSKLSDLRVVVVRDGCLNSNCAGHGRLFPQQGSPRSQSKT
jgi:hypothetical protein